MRAEASMCWLHSLLRAAADCCNSLYPAMPQHYASWSGVLEAVVALLSAGANILARSGWVLAVAAQASAAYTI